MGIKSLMKLLAEEAPESFKETEKESYFNRMVAVDASMQLYALLMQIRTSQGGTGPATHLTNEAGEVTSHLLGMLHRTIGMMSKGLKPVFVFDGKPPELKMEELRARREMKDKAAAAAENAKQQLAAAEKDKEEEEEEEGVDAAARQAKMDEAIAEIDKASKRSTHVTKEHNEEVQKLLGLMGVPFLLAPSEAEAQCAELARKGKVFAVATEDMDTLAFGTPILLRKLTRPDSQHEKVVEIHLDFVLAKLALTMDQFVDLCILCGCDYCPSIRGIGPKNALKLIREHKTIEEVAKHLDPSKFQVPEAMMSKLAAIREVFKHPETTPAEQVDIKFGAVNEQGLIEFLVRDKGFDEGRVKSALQKLAACKEIKQQQRIDSFFKPAQPATGPVTGFKRKPEDDNKPGKGVSKNKKPMGSSSRGRGK
jgi:flap endonuclease-1